MSHSITDIIKNPALLLLTLGHREYFNWVSDKSYLKIAFWARMHKKLDLEIVQRKTAMAQTLRPESTIHTVVRQIRSKGHRRRYHRARIPHPHTRCMGEIRGYRFFETTRTFRAEMYARQRRCDRLQGQIKTEL